MRSSRRTGEQKKVQVQIASNTHFLPDDGVGVQWLADREHLRYVLVLQEIVFVGHIVRPHVRNNFRIAGPAIERHLVAAQVDVLIREHLHDLGEQVAHEFI